MTRSSSSWKFLTGEAQIKMASRLLGGHIQIVATLGLLLLVTKAQNQNPNVTPVHKRFEYKYSFKPPYLAQKDGTVPFFEYSGSK